MLSDRPSDSSPPSSIDAFLLDVKQRVDRRLVQYFEQKRLRARALSGPSEELVDALYDFTMRGGKRTRPAVLIAGHLAVDRARRDLETLLDACAGLELLQSYLLVHDDWMDQDDERRGGITLHKLFGERTGDRHLGASLAVLAGDLGNGFAIELVARQRRCPSSTARAALEVFWDMQQDVVWGQALDLIAYRDVALIQRLKTGSYSVKGPLLLGAVMGGCQRGPARWRSSAYADPVGHAFQGRDDLLGTFGAPEKTGKPAGNDLRAGKRTALVEEAEKRLSESELGPLRAVLGKTDASEADVRKAMELLERSGAKQAVEERVDELCGEAQAALRHADFFEEGASRLEQLARKFASRDTDALVRRSHAWRSDTAKSSCLASTAWCTGGPRWRWRSPAAPRCSAKPATDGPTTLHIAPWNVDIDTGDEPNYGREPLQQALKVARSHVRRRAASWRCTPSMRLPSGAGMGSSAALGVAVLRAMDEARGISRTGRRGLRALARLGARVPRQPVGRRQRHGHLRRHGHLQARRSPLTRIVPRNPIRLIAALQRHRRSTKEMVESVARQLEKEPGAHRQAVRRDRRASSATASWRSSRAT